MRQSDCQEAGGLSLRRFSQDYTKHPRVTKIGIWELDRIRCNYLNFMYFMTTSIVLFVVISELVN